MNKPSCGHAVCEWIADGACHMDDPDLFNRVIHSNLDPEAVRRRAEEILGDPAAHPAVKQSIREALTAPDDKFNKGRKKG